MRLFALLLCTILLSSIRSQNTQIVSLLDNEVNESSALIQVDNKIYTINDSGGEAVFYEIDTSTGSVIDRKYILNASNNDWEALCKDESYLYIGDFGNNSGSRNNLCIYKIKLNDFTQSDSINASLIYFSYEDQINFVPSNSHHFDAEAFVALADSLYIFTKNRDNFKTHIYSLPKDTGTYSAKRKGEINVEGLITDAYYYKQKNRIALLGYSIGAPFITFLTITDSLFTSYNVDSKSLLELPINTSVQTEGLWIQNDERYFVSAEKSNGNSPVLYAFRNYYTSIPSVSETLIRIYPNPSSSKLTIDYPTHKMLNVEIYSVHGKRILLTNKPHVSLKKGVFLIKVYLDNKLSKTQKIVIK